MQAYCVKCRAKKEIKDPRAVTTKNGKPATRGICPTCGGKGIQDREGSELTGDF